MLTQMIGQGGWDVYVTGVNGFVGKEHGQPFFNGFVCGFFLLC